MNLKEKLMPPRPNAYPAPYRSLFNSVILDPKIYDGYKRALQDAQDLFNDWYDREIVKLFENAVVKYGRIDENGLWSHKPVDSDTHQGLLIGRTPIERGVTKEEIIKALRSEAFTDHYSGKSKSEFQELAARIEREGIKP